MNQHHYLLIRTLIHCTYSPRRFRVNRDELVKIRDSFMRHWQTWQRSLVEMRKTEKLLNRIIDSDGLGRDEKRLVISQINRLNAITDEAYEA